MICPESLLFAGKVDFTNPEKRTERGIASRVPATFSN
jgi:hypothetical protein